jgi:hypothetical protein
MKRFLLSLFFILLTSSNLFSVTAGEWLATANYAVSRHSVFLNYLEASCASHVDIYSYNNIDVTYCYLRGIEYAVASYLLDDVQYALQHYPSLLSSYPWLSQSNMDYFDSIMQDRIAWAKSLSREGTGAFLAGCVAAGELHTDSYSFNMAALNNLVRRYLGSDWVSDN